MGMGRSMVWCLLGACEVVAFFEHKRVTHRKQLCLFSQSRPKNDCDGVSGLFLCLDRQKLVAIDIETVW